MSIGMICLKGPTVINFQHGMLRGVQRFVRHFDMGVSWGITTKRI